MSRASAASTEEQHDEWRQTKKEGDPRHPRRKNGEEPPKRRRHRRDAGVELHDAYVERRRHGDGQGGDSHAQDGVVGAVVVPRETVGQDREDLGEGDSDQDREHGVSSAGLSASWGKQRRIRVNPKRTRDHIEN